MARTVICLDFDGVLHWNRLPWRGRDVIRDEPVPGAREAVDSLRRRAIVLVHSGRCATEAGAAAIERWLQRHGIRVDQVCRQKPAADLFLDDHAVTFRGDWPQAIEDLKAFRAWTAAPRRMARQDGSS